MGEIALLGCNCLKPADLGFNGLLVDVLREEQRDIDIDSLADERLDCLQSRRSSARESMSISRCSSRRTSTSRSLKPMSAGLRQLQPNRAISPILRAWQA